MSHIGVFWTVNPLSVEKEMFIMVVFMKEISQQKKAQDWSTLQRLFCPKWRCNEVKL